eukprot:2996266-Prymnesium_polylepis.1
MGCGRRRRRAATPSPVAGHVPRCGRVLPKRPTINAVLRAGNAVLRAGARLLACLCTARLAARRARLPVPARTRARPAVAACACMCNARPTAVCARERARAVAATLCSSTTRRVS